MTASVSPRSARGPRRTFAAYAEALGRFDVSASRLTPLLRQQGLVMFGAAVFLLALLAGLYLQVTSAAAIAGRDVQNMESAMIAEERLNADIEAQTALLLSSHNLAQRAKALGFESISRDQIEYILVPGYDPLQPVHFTGAEAADVLTPASDPAYRQTLLQWLAEQMEKAAAPLP